MTSDIINLPSNQVMELSFDWAHNYWDTAPSEAGYVEISTDNVTWASLWSRTGTAFDSDPTNMFPPAFATESISLAGYTGQSVYIRVKGVSGYGSDFMFDNICIYSAGTVMPGSISGVILDDTSEAYSGLTATLVQTGETCVTDTVGLYSFQNVSPGVYDVEFSLQGYPLDKIENIIVTSNADVTAEIMIERGGILTGNVINELGDPVLTAVSLSDIFLMGPTDSTGTYYITGIPEGMYFAFVNTMFYCSEMIDSIQISNDSVTVVDFQIVHNCRIHLAITTFDNVYEQLQISVTGAQDYSFPHHYNQITLRDMRPGTYDVTVTRDGCAPFVSLGNVVAPATCDTIEVFLDELTGVTENNIGKFRTEFSGVHPNPFNPETSLNYSIAEEGKAELSIYNIKGQKVRTLVSRSHEPGEYSVIWKGKADDDKSVSSGVYFAVLKTGKKVMHQKLMLLK